MGITWDQLRTRINHAVTERGEWAGAPMPIDDLRLVIEPRYPYHQLNGAVFSGDHLTRREQSSLPAGGKIEVINSWYSEKRSSTIYIIREADGNREHLLVPEYGGRKLEFWINTLGASRAWGEETEAKALTKLKQLCTPHGYKCYILTGSFLETSKRSNVTYFFRKARPTIAIRCTQNGSRILATLCLHPIGYYEKSWAGVMCPTDDVIAHLPMMRGDEAKFWAKANHHPSWMAEAGL